MQGEFSGSRICSGRDWKMPLLKQEVFLLAETPEDLSPEEMVFQVRFTKEIFRDYDEFVKRMNLYRQKLWTCKVTGKGGLTYEKALVSELRSAQRSEFPRDFMGPVLRMVQFSALQLDELAQNIFKTFTETYVIGEVVSSVKESVICRCKVLDVSQEDGGDGPQYEVGWLDADGRVKERSVLKASDLLKRNPPFTKEALKKFIQESAYGDELPWLVRDKLVRKFKLPSEPPEREKQIHARQDPNQRQVNQAYFDESLQEIEYTGRKRNKRHRENGSTKSRKDSRKNEGCSSPQQSEELVDDSLLEADSPLPRPIPCNEFAVEADCIGSLLMVWDFCNSFTKLLQLSQFSLHDLERALVHTEGESALLSEAYFAILRLVLGEHGVKQRLAQRRKRKVLLTIDTWKDDLCDYLDLEGPEKLKPDLSTFRKDWYSSTITSKLAIFEELIERAVSTAALRNQLDENVEEHEKLSAQKRAEGLPISMRKGSRFAEKAKRESPEKSTAGTPEKATEERYENGYGEDNSQKECLHENGCLIGWLKKGKRKRIGNSEVKREYSARCLFFNSARQTLFKCSRVELHNDREPQTEKEKAETMLQKRLESLDRELDKCAIRVTALGKDRDHNRYWFFHREGRIFVESDDSKHWSFYSSKKELDELFQSLNQRGAREKALRDQLESSYSKISSSMQRRSRDMMQRTALEEANIRRSLRVQSAPRPTGFLAYVNKMRL